MKFHDKQNYEIIAKYVEASHNFVDHETLDSYFNYVLGIKFM